MLDNGEAYNAVGEDTIVKYSEYNYHTICIIFGNKKPVDVYGNSKDRICNYIVESSGVLENYISAGDIDPNTPGLQTGEEIDTNTYLSNDW